MTSLDNIELAGLSEAEIAELSEFIDPDVRNMNHSINVDTLGTNPY